MGVYLIAESWWLQPENLASAATAAFGLGLVIFVHELGHFLVAKACGVKCEKFYIGFDVPLPLGLPSALFKKRWGETEYGIGIIPLGGYVKMLGQDDNPQNAAAEAERIRKAKTEPGSDGDFEIDPRSYPAKTVPQRMAIISAGVVMNLIFAVLFAAAAYILGLSYTPAIVGATMPGDSAWRAGIRPGDHLIQFGHDGRRDEQLRFRDLRYNVMKNDDGEAFDVLVQRDDGSETWRSLQPKSRENENAGLATIGVISPPSTRIYKLPYDDGSAAATSDLQSHDEVKSITIDGEQYPVENGIALQETIYRHPNQAITLVVERPEDPQEKSSPVTSLQIVLPPQPIRDLGLRMDMGPVVAIQTDSPAALAGFELSDIITAVNGQPLENALQVDQILLGFVGTPVEITVQRGTLPVTLTATPRAPEMVGESRRESGPTSAETLGIAYLVQDIVQSVVAESPAAVAGLQSGDRVTQIEFVRREDASLDRELFRQMKLDEPLKFPQDSSNWAYFDFLLQRMPTGVDVKLTFLRDHAEDAVTLTPALSNAYFNPHRGLLFEGMTRTRTAGSIGDAFSLGVRETKEGVLQVVVTLKKIGKLFKHLGGPGMIAYAATSEASEGLPRLLAFLTLLSANLAVLNFLPIPVLDGGHMMFLLYEGVFGKPMPEKVAFFATMMGLCLILGLMVFVIGMDVYRFTGFAG